MNPCGTILSNCDPTDWWTIIWPVIEAPNYDRDPSCTIPYLCGEPWSTTTTGTTNN
jgi:hypothetical protein